MRMKKIPHALMMAWRILCSIMSVNVSEITNMYKIDSRLAIVHRRGRRSGSPEPEQGSRCFARRVLRVFYIYGNSVRSFRFEICCGARTANLSRRSYIETSIELKHRKPAEISPTGTMSFRGHTRATSGGGRAARARRRHDKDVIRFEN